MLCFAIFTLLSTVAQTLVIEAEITDIRHSPRERIDTIFGSLHYDQETLGNLSALLVSSPSPHLHDAWRGTSLDKIASQLVFESYICILKWHHALLPLDLILFNKDLMELVDANWEKYQPIYYDLAYAYPILSQDKWQMRIFEAAKQRPALVKGILGDYGVSRGYLEYLHLGKCNASLDNFPVLEWIEGLESWLLVQLQIQIADPYYGLTTSFESTQQNSVDRALFRNFKSDPLRHYQPLLTRIKELLKETSASKTALWHGKLLYSLIKGVKLLPEHQIEEFLMRYSPLDYQEAILLELRPWMIKAGMFQKSPSSPLALRMFQLGKLHSAMLPVVSENAKLLMFWNNVQEFAEPLKPPSQPCTWLDICRLIVNVSPDEILPPKFENPITIVSQSASSQSKHTLHDIHDLLHDLPAWLVQQNYLSMIFFNSTPDFHVNNQVFISQVIGRLLVWGIHHTGQDVFNFTFSVWECLLSGWNYQMFDKHALKEMTDILNWHKIYLNPLPVHI